MEGRRTVVTAAGYSGTRRPVVEFRSPKREFSRTKSAVHTDETLAATRYPRDMELREGLEFARTRQQGVLVTRRADGRPQLSNILYHLSGGGEGGGASAGAAGAGAAGAGGGAVARISVTDPRAKTRNLRRHPFASLYVPGDSFWSYVVLDGTAELSEVAEAPDDATAEELVDLYRSLRGEEHPDWAEYRQAMVSERRLVVRLHPTYAYGMARR